MKVRENKRENKGVLDLVYTSKMREIKLLLFVEENSRF